MTLTETLIEALRREWKAELRTQRVAINGRIGRVDGKVDQLRGELGDYHTETLHGFAAAGDELATLRTMLEPVAAAYARRERRRARRRAFARSAYGRAIGAASAAGAIATVIALLT